MPTLAKLQRQFKDLMLAGSPDAAVLSFIAEQAPLDRQTRFEIYHRSYRSLWMAALETDFPLSFACIGAPLLEELLKKYARVYPSRYTSLSEISQDFPVFLAAERLPQPWIADLARFEWAYILAATAGTVPETPPLEAAAVAAGDSSKMTLALNPSLQLLELSWNVQHWPEQKELQKGETLLAVYEHADKSCWQELSRPQFEILRRVQQEVSLDDLPQGLTVSEEEVAEWFGNWAQEGMFAGFKSLS